jgi:hypothetical protein
MLLKNSLLVTFLFLSLSAFSTHLRCGQILVEYQSGRTVKIVIQVYTNTEGTLVLFGGDQDILYFGDGNSLNVPETEGIIVDELDPTGHTRMAQFEVTHTYSSAGKYLISYTEPNRNEGVINFDGSVNTPFYLETSYVLDPFVGTVNSPVSFFHPIFYGYEDSPSSISLASKATDGSELTYTLVTPLQAANKRVPNYQLPENFRIDRLNGLVTWDNKFNGVYVAGEYLFSIRIDQFRKVNDETIRVGYVYRDLQIILFDESSGLGRLENSLDQPTLMVTENNSGNFKLFSWAGAGESQNFKVVSDLPEGNLSFETYDSTSEDGPLKVTLIIVEISSDIVRNAPYTIAVRNQVSKNETKYVRDSNVSIFTKQYDPILSVDNIRENIAFYPNPVRENISWSNNLPAHSRIEVVHINGQMVLNKKITDETSVLLSNLKPGLYLISVISPSGKILTRSRIVKE